jgi:hypothetical protein
MELYLQSPIHPHSEVKEQDISGCPRLSPLSTLPAVIFIVFKYYIGPCTLTLALLKYKMFRQMDVSIMMYRWGEGESCSVGPVLGIVAPDGGNGTTARNAAY